MHYRLLIELTRLLDLINERATQLHLNIAGLFVLILIITINNLELCVFLVILELLDSFSVLQSLQQMLTNIVLATPIVKFSPSLPTDSLDCG